MQQGPGGPVWPAAYTGPPDPNLGPVPPPGGLGPGPLLAQEHWPAPNLYPSPAPPGAPEGLLAPGGNPPTGQPAAKEPLLAAMWDREVPNICGDYANYYSLPNAIKLAAGLGIAAGLSSSDLDGEIATWYQTRIRTPGTDRVANFVRPFGEGQYTIPVAAGLALLNDTGWLDDRPVLSELGQWGDRVARAYLVGGPPMLAMQYLTGGSRPRDVGGHSSWQPFSASNGVSGDAFMSTCMFISAADMTEQPLGKGFFYACSFVVPWERIDLNAHFFSQAALGWWMAYLACDAVNSTERAKRHVTIVPLASPEMTGIGVMYQH
ncbi:MAG: hypothetical protein ABSG86_19095 [Thermoguttaceae bacterium]